MDRNDRQLSNRHACAPPRSGAKHFPYFRQRNFDVLKVDFRPISHHEKLVYNSGILSF